MMINKISIRMFTLAMVIFGTGFIIPGFGLSNPASDNIEGTWRYQDQYEIIVLQFNTGNTYNLQVQSSIDGDSYITGTYSFDGQYLTAQPQGEPPGTYPARLLNNSLELDLGQDGIIVLNRTGPAATPGHQQQQGMNQQTNKPATTNMGGKRDLVLVPYADRTEHAFTILMPQGWNASGGITRVAPTQVNGVAQSIEAKLDFGMSDPNGKVVLRWLPHTYFTSLQNSPAGGMFQQGSNYGGMTVMPLMSPQEFAATMVFPTLHQGAQNAQVVEEKDMPRLAALYANSQTNALGMGYKAGMITVDFTESGQPFREKIVVVIEDRGPLTMGQWCNRFTMVGKAPVNEYDYWQTVFALVSDSSKLDMNWLRGELQGQIKRGEIALGQQQQVQEIEQSITDHRRKTNAEINNDMFLTLTDQEEYVNPHTNQIEMGTNQWQRRWQNDLGHVIYTDNESYDPNTDPAFNAGNFRVSQIRPR